MKRPAYTDALEHILETRANDVEHLAAEFPRTACAILKRWPVVVMTAALWRTTPMRVAENLLRLRDLRAGVRR